MSLLRQGLQHQVLAGAPHRDGAQGSQEGLSRVRKGKLCFFYALGGCRAHPRVPDVRLTILVPQVLSDLWKHMRTVHGFYRRRTKIPKEELDLSTPVLQIANGIKNRDDKEIDEQKPKRRKTNSVGSKGDPDIKQE